jgi:hypothetical protein
MVVETQPRVRKLSEATLHVATRYRQQAGAYFVFTRIQQPTLDSDLTLNTSNFHPEVRFNYFQVIIGQSASKEITANGKNW